MRALHGAGRLLASICALTLALAPVSVAHAGTPTETNTSVEQTLLTHGISASQVQELRFYAGTVATFLRNGTIDDAQAQNLVSGLIAGFTNANNEAHVPIEHLPMPNMTSRTSASSPATASSTTISPLTTTSNTRGCSSTGCGYFVLSTQSSSTHWNQATAYVTLPSMYIPSADVGNDYGYMMYGAVSSSAYSEDIGLRYTDGLANYTNGWHLFYCVQNSTQTGDNCITHTFTVTISDPYEWITIDNNAVYLQVIDPSGWTVLDTITESDSYAGWGNTGSDQQIQQESTIAQYTKNWDDGSTLTDGGWDEAYLYYPSGGYEYYDLWTPTYTSDVWTCPQHVSVSMTSQYNDYTPSVDLTSTQTCS